MSTRSVLATSIAAWLVLHVDPWVLGSTYAQISGAPPVQLPGLPRGQPQEPAPDPAANAKDSEDGPTDDGKLNAESVALIRWSGRDVPEPAWLVRRDEGCVQIESRVGTWVVVSQLELGRSSDEIERYCNYIWVSNGETPPDRSALRRAGVQSAAADPPIVASLSGSEYVDKWLKPLRELTRARLGIPDYRPEHPGDARVRVAVLDTANDANGDLLDITGHGTAVGRLVTELACGELASCATQVEYVPVLSLLSDTTQMISHGPRGAGAYGTRGMLAAKIDEVSGAWERDGRASPLIINLSLGWSGCWDAVEPLGEELVRRALVRATCRGALVIAAGGNGDVIDGCPDSAPRGAKPRHMLPGLWGGKQVTRLECTNEGILDPRMVDGTPLLIGASGVDAEDQPLYPHGHEADLVTYAQYVTVTEPDDPSGMTTPLSGTSMSAAALSGMAAAMLSYDPTLSVADVHDRLHAAAVWLRDPAVPADPSDDHFICNRRASTGACGGVRRLRLCDLLLQMPAIAGAVGCEDPDRRALTPMGMMSATASSEVADDCGASGCEPPTDSTNDDVQDTPWVGEQPDPPACGTCLLVRAPGRTLPFLQAAFNKDISDVMLTITVGSVETNYDLRSVRANQATEWNVPAAAASAATTRLRYRPTGTRIWEEGTIKFGTTPVFERGAVRAVAK